MTFKIQTVENCWNDIALVCEKHHLILWLSYWNLLDLAKKRNIDVNWLSVFKYPQLVIPSMTVFNYHLVAINIVNLFNYSVLISSHLLPPVLFLRVLDVETDDPVIRILVICEIPPLCAFVPDVAPACFPLIKYRLEGQLLVELWHIWDIYVVLKIYLFWTPPSSESQILSIRSFGHLEGMIWLIGTFVDKLIFLLFLPEFMIIHLVMWKSFGLNILSIDLWQVFFKVARIEKSLVISIPRWSTKLDFFDFVLEGFFVLYVIYKYFLPIWALFISCKRNKIAILTKSHRIMIYSFIFGSKIWEIYKFLSSRFWLLLVKFKLIFFFYFI